MAFYTVQQGDTLGTIAQAFGTTVDALAAANPDILDPDQIFAGQTLCVPAWGTYQAQEGDTLGGIAQAFGTTVDALVVANDFEDPDVIVAGQTLVVPFLGTYVVQPGNTLSGIARTFGTTVDALVAANCGVIRDPNIILLGQTLAVPFLEVPAQDDRPLEFLTHRKEVSTLTQQRRARLRQLLDTYINTQDPVGDHHEASMDPSLQIHGVGFIAWHYVFVGKLENWLVVNGARAFVPLPYWDPGTPIPAELDKNNTDPNMPLPSNLRPGAIENIPNYMTLNNEMVPYHNMVHNASGGMMPFPHASPSDPLFWPFHAFLVAIYEYWRTH
jgi:LysM repeat protein